MNIKTILVSAVICILLDAVYISSTLSLFQRQIVGIQGEKIRLNIPAAILCYIFIVLGLNYFILSSSPKKSWRDAFILGVVIYAIYELTSKAIFDKKWYWSIVAMDTLWGGVLFALTTILTQKAVKLF